MRPLGPSLPVSCVYAPVIPRVTDARVFVTRRIVAEERRQSPSRDPRDL